MDLYSFFRFFWTRQLTDRAILAIGQTQEKKMFLNAANAQIAHCTRRHSCIIKDLLVVHIGPPLREPLLEVFHEAGRSFCQWHLLIIIAGGLSHGLAGQLNWLKDNGTMCLHDSHQWRSADTIEWLRTRGLHSVPNSIKADIGDLVYNGPRSKTPDDSAAIVQPPGRFVYNTGGRASNDPPPGL